MNEYIVPMETGRVQSPRTRLRPPICDSNIVQNWLRLCCEHHGGRCTVHSKKPMTSLRLVDVLEGKISSFTQNSGFAIPPHASLSWVWGHTKASDGLTTRQLYQADEKGFLNSSEMSSTIADAITFLQVMGIRYLWVDLLCIVQDNTKDKDFYMPLLGSVYTASEFTIVAYGRKGASDSIAGVRADTRSGSQ